MTLKSVLFILSILMPSTVFAQDAFDLSRAVLEGGSPSVADRAQSATITQITFTADGVVVDFTKRDGANRWPDVVPPGWDGPIEYTLWVGMQLQGQWHVCGVIEFWFGRGIDADLNAGSDVTVNQQIQRNWTYFCGPMARQPNPGEPIAFLVTSGDQRRMDIAAVRERSNVVVVPFPASAPAVFPMVGGPPPIVVTPPPPPPPVIVPPVVQPPVVVPPVVTPPVFDASALAAQIAELKADVDAGRAENQAFYEHVGVQWGKVLAFVGKWGGSAVAVILGAMKVAGK